VGTALEKEHDARTKAAPADRTWGKILILMENLSNTAVLEKAFQPINLERILAVISIALIHLQSILSMKDDDWLWMPRPQFALKT